MAKRNSGKRRSLGRPKASDGPAVTRTELLQIAAGMIGERGFRGTSIRALADAADVTYGTVQHHFPNKQSLWEALVDEVLVPALAQPVTAEPAGISDAVTATVRRRIEAAVIRPGLSAAILMDTSEGAEQRLAYLAAAIRGQRDSNFAMLQTLVQNGQLRSVNPRSIAALFGIGLASLASATTAMRELLDIDIKDAQERDRLVADIADIVLYGLLPRR